MNQESTSNSVSASLAKTVLALCAGFLTTGLVVGITIAATTIVTPSDTAPNTIEKWGPANDRDNATVEITTAQPRSGDGSLMFFTDTVTNGQDKADFEIFWDIDEHPSRTLGNLTTLQFEWYRDSSSTVAGHFAPALRLYYQNALSETGYLIWEPVYNGYGAVPTNTWVTSAITGDNFWMRTFNPGVTIEKYNITLAQWMVDNNIDPNSHVLGPDTQIVGINIGVGSGWGNSFLGYVDNVEIEFNGNDSVSANFEPDSENLLYFPIIFKN